MTLLILEKLIPKVGELELLELDRQMLLNVEVNLLLSGPVHKEDLIFVGEEHKYFVGGVVDDIGYQSLFVFFGVLGYDEPVALFNVVLVTFDLVDQLIVGKESQSFRGLAKVALDNGAKAIEVNAIDDVEVVILIVSDLIDGIFADDH